MSDLENILSDQVFKRVHKSYLVNTSKINNLKYYAGGYYKAYFKDFGNAFVMVSKTKAKDLKKMMQLI